jgi:hypothetical protein
VKRKLFQFEENIAAKVLKHEGAKFCNTKARSHEDTKLFFKTKMLIIETCFQPIEHIEPFEP